MQQRINISLPEETIKLIDRVTKRGSRSRLIDAAVRHYVSAVGRARLQSQLAEGYRKLSKSSLEISADWFSVDEDTWRNAGL